MQPRAAYRQKSATSPSSLLFTFASALALLLHRASAMPISTNGQCQTNGAACAPGFCCSQIGWCGTTALHCSAGCQPDWGTCWSTSTSATTPTTTTSLETAAQTATTSTTASPPSTSIRVIRSCVAPNTVAITFDDGPYTYTSQISQQFTQAGGRVTFFLNGLNWACIYDHAEKVKAAFDAGHQIGSHTWGHPDLTTQSVEVVISQMTRLSGAFQKILGAVPVYMRPPYGRYNNVILGILQSLGFKVVATWDIDSGDALGASTAQQQTTYNSASTNTSHVILHHETSSNTALNMVPFIISWAKQRGLKMVTVGECLGDSPVNWYKGYVNAETRNPSWTCF